MSKILVKSILLFLMLLGMASVSLGQSPYTISRLNRIFDVSSKIASDSLGCMWISDQDGLYRYDGYDFKQVSFSRIFGQTFKNKSVTLFERDKRGNFWLATENGELVRMLPDGHTTNYSADIKKIALRAAASNNDRVLFGGADGSIWIFDVVQNKLFKKSELPKLQGKNQGILDMVMSEKGTLYISTIRGAVYTYDILKNNLDKLEVPLHQETQEMLFMVTDQRSRLWISTEYQGLLCYDPMTKQITRYGERGDDKNEYMMYRSIYCDQEGIIWLGTDGYGLRRLDPKNGKITVFEHQVGNNFSLSNNTVRYINGDNNGNLWVIVKGGLVHVLSNNNYPIASTSGLPSNIPHRVLSILKSSDKSLWIGSDGEGLSRILPQGAREHYGRKGRSGSSFKGRFIQALAEDNAGNIWIGTYQNGLYRFDKRRQLFQEIPVGESLGVPLLKDFRSIYLDSKRRLWVGSTYGLHVLSEQGRLLATYVYGQQGTAGAIADAVFEDKVGQIWVAFSKGVLTKFKETPGNLQASTFEDIPFHKWENNAARYYSITQIVQDKAGVLWFRCDGGFLIQFDPVKRSYRSFENDSELRAIDITSMALDADGMFWLGSRNGLYHYDPIGQRIINYGMSDGLLDNLFIRKSVFQAKDGELFFGGNNGVSSFYPKSLTHNPTTARLMITGLQVLNKPAEDVLDNLPMDNLNLYLKELKLKAQQSSFSISFSAVGNLLNTSYKYQYRLKGFEDDFSEPNEKRTATYTNLPAGHYTFELVAAQQGSDVFDIGPLTMEVYIAPYWWQSIPAKIIYFLLFLVFVYAIWRWIMMRARLHQEELVRKQEAELYHLKMNFFAKISHEIQTPLSLIIGPMDALFAKKGNEDGNSQENRQLRMIKDNAQRLSRIVSELTHVRDREIGKLTLKIEESNFTDHLRRIVLSFEELARQKGIEFIAHLTEYDGISAYDYLKMEHVIYNLLGNAVKFTPTGGQVILIHEMSEDGKAWRIEVKDTGPGMDKETAERVFDFFYQGAEGKVSKTGLGIGLALSREIVQLHGGDISLRSEVGEGTSFVIVLPIGVSQIDKQLERESAIPAMPTKDWTGEPILIANQAFSVLVVDDNLDMQLFLSDLLGEFFKTAIVDNGSKAIEYLQENSVDLILSDIMMPVMDGLELAERLQAHAAFKHIPIVLLTAYPSETNKYKGLKSGVVSYLSKPFHPEELLLLMQNILIKQQSAMHQYRDKMTSMPVIEAGKRTKDDHFLMKLTEVLKEKVADVDFLLEDLEKLMNMSYSVIFKKCQEITGVTPSEYFRKIKLKKAAILLVEYNYSVSEASFEVGFTDSKYFSKLFKETFKQTPSVFKNQMTKDRLEAFLQEF